MVTNYEERQIAVRNDISKDSKPQKYNHWESRKYLVISGILSSFGLLNWPWMQTLQPQAKVLE